MDSKMKTMLIDEEKYRTLFNNKFENRKFWKNPECKNITSILPGTVIKIQLSEGENVTPGQKMVVLEAMKMHNQLNCPYKGVVRKVCVTEGQSIPKGFTMFELE